jgi:hypothetical protein
MIQWILGTILQTREATRPKKTKSPQPPNSVLSTPEKQLYLQSKKKDNDRLLVVLCA